MSIIVTDSGFADDVWADGFAPLDTANSDGQALDIPSDYDPRLATEIVLTAPMLRIDFPSFADGRGFTIAAHLRRLGFTGALRARGHVIADQYAMARRSGFDEVEISDDLAKRQPAEQWMRRADWKAHSYQNRVSQTGHPLPTVANSLID
ncbi:MAG: DUF934 domain-containing protein [Planktomarina sp.]